MNMTIRERLTLELHKKAKKLLLESVQIQKTRAPDGKVPDKALQVIARFNHRKTEQEE